METIKRLYSVRPPKVNITLDCEIGSAIQKISLPLMLGLLDWPEKMVAEAKLRQSDEITINHFDATFPMLLADVMNSADLTESLLYRLIYRAVHGACIDSPYAAIFVRGMQPLSQPERMKLAELANICHIAFILDYSDECSPGLELLINLCEQFEARGWFKDTGLPMFPSMEIIHAGEPSGSDFSVIMPRLCGSRFAHYVVSIMSNRADEFSSKSEYEDFLNNWIAQYVLLDDYTSEEISAAYPLRKARISVENIASSPSGYSAKLEVQLGFGYGDAPAFSFNCVPLLSN